MTSYMNLDLSDFNGLLHYIFIEKSRFEIEAVRKDLRTIVQRKGKDKKKELVKGNILLWL